MGLSHWGLAESYPASGPELGGRSESSPVLVLLDHRSCELGGACNLQCSKAPCVNMPCKEQKLNIMVMNLDLEKANDRLTHNFLFKVLTEMVFLRRWVGWILFIYQEVESQILTNGHLCCDFKIQVGVWGECLMPPVHLTCVLEPLLNA